MHISISRESVLSTLVNTHLTCLYPYCGWPLTSHLPPPHTHEHCPLQLCKGSHLALFHNSYYARLGLQIELLCSSLKVPTWYHFLFLCNNPHQILVRLGDTSDPSSQVGQLGESSWVKAEMQYPEWCIPAGLHPGFSIEKLIPSWTLDSQYGCRAKIRRVQSTGVLSFL